MGWIIPYAALAQIAQSLTHLIDRAGDRSVLVHAEDLGLRIKRQVLDVVLVRLQWRVWVAVDLHLFGGNKIKIVIPGKI